MIRSAKFWFIVLAMASVLRAELVWESKELRLTASPGQAAVTGEYRYRNPGPATVEITRAAPSCDCTEVQPAAAAVPPGGAGVIFVKYTVGSRTGEQSAKIAVTTHDAPNQPTVLALSVFIQEAISVQPRLVYWLRGSAATEQAVEIVAAEPHQCAVESASCADPAFSVRVEPSKQPGRYRVWIKPTGVSKPAQAAVRIELRSDGRQETRIVYAAIK